MPANPLQLIPARIRAVVYILALVISVAVPVILPGLTSGWQYAAQALAAVAALFASTQGLANLTPDDQNPALARKQTPERAG